MKSRDEVLTLKDQIIYFQVDAFTEHLFEGNPAGVCLLTQALDDDLLLNMAGEHHLAETAFIECVNGQLHLRWFTPELEMDLCGHATLAAAHVILSEPTAHEWLMQYGLSMSDQVLFQTQSGALTVTRSGQSYVLDFPSRPARMLQNWRADQEILTIVEALGVMPLEVWRSRDVLCVYDDPMVVTQLTPDPIRLGGVDLGTGGVIVTAPGTVNRLNDAKVSHFISRFFTPQASLFEDDVTGSAHCTLAPFWSERLNLKSLIAHQVSTRGGWLSLQLHQEDQDNGPNQNRVWISGQAITYLEAILRIKR